MTPLLVLGGTPPSRELIVALLDSHAPVVAADAGALVLERHALRPDVVIGDFDNAGVDVDDLRSRGVEVVVDRDQDTNDLEKAMGWIARKGYQRLAAIGTGGGMFDHAINNLSVLARWGRALSVQVLDDASIAYVTHEAIAIDVSIGERISLIPLPHAVMTTEGLAWPLRRSELFIGGREGASNESVARRVTIEVHSGCVMVFHYPVSGTLTELARQKGKKQ